jgi:hypothetical protein
VQAHESGEHGAESNDEGHPEIRYVFSSLLPVWVRRRSWTFGEAKAQEHHQRSGDVREVVRCVAE